MLSADVVAIKRTGAVDLSRHLVYEISTWLVSSNNERSLRVDSFCDANGSGRLPNVLGEMAAVAESAGIGAENTRWAASCVDIAILMVGEIPVSIFSLPHCCRLRQSQSPS